MSDEGNLILVIIGIIAVALVLFSVVVIIPTGYVGVHTTFGKADYIMQPGLNFIIPFIQGSDGMPTVIQKYEVGASAASKDLQDVQTTIAVNYRLSGSNDNMLGLYNNFRTNYEYSMIQPTVQEVVKSATAKFTAEELITRRADVKDTIERGLRDRLSIYGITIEQVAITNFEFSKTFNAAIEAKVIVDQKKQQSQLELEQKQIEVQKLVVEQNATATAQVIQANADMQAKILRAFGEANATLVQATAQAKAIELVQSKLTPEYVQFQYSQRWNGALPNYMLGGSNLLLGMPLSNNASN